MGGGPSVKRHSCLVNFLSVLPFLSKGFFSSRKSVIGLCHSIKIFAVKWTSSGGSRISSLGGHGLPRQLHFIKFVCQNERIGSLREAHAGCALLNLPMTSLPTLHEYLYQSLFATSKLKPAQCRISFFFSSYCLPLEDTPSWLIFCVFSLVSMLWYLSLELMLCVRLVGPWCPVNLDRPPPMENSVTMHFP